MILTMKKLEEADNVRKQAEELYMRAFPANERIPFSAIASDVTDIRETYVFLTKEQLFAGIASLIRNGDIVHILYLAVEEKFRGRGFGTEILKQIHEKNQGRRIIVDIEKPEPGTRNETERINRKNFYLRAGYHETPVRYTWRSEDYEILCQQGTITEQEFWDFWNALDIRR